MVTTDDALRRGNCFKLLAACFYEPDKELFLEERLCENMAAQLLPLAPDAATAAESMLAALRETAREQLSVDYAALFVGPFELIAAPYGSVYLEKHGRVMGDSTIATQRFYQAAGLSLEMKEPPDHIAIELEFMHYLCMKEAAALSAGAEDEACRFREQQVRFFREIMGWIPEFSGLAGPGAATSFYRALASCLAAFYTCCRKEYLAAPVN
jgi:TorA maturation chaperone TorD